MKKFLLIMSALFLCLVLFGCGSQHTISSAPQTQPAESSTEPTQPVVTAIKNFTFACEPKSYQTDAYIIYAAMVNKTESTYSFGREYSLEFYQNSAWTNIPLGNTMWTSEKTLLYAGSTGKIEFEIGEITGSLQAGTYRIVLPVRNEDTDEDLHIAAEFTIKQEQ